MLLHCELLPQFYWPRVGVHTDNSTDHLQDHSNMSGSPATSITIDTTVFNLLTSRAKLLHADEVTHMFFGCVGISFIQCGLKIVKYIHHIVGVSRQDVLKWFHVTKMSYISVLATDFTIALITFMVSARHEGPTRSATSSAFTNGFLIQSTLFVVRETRLVPKMSVTFGGWNSESG